MKRPIPQIEEYLQKANKEVAFLQSEISRLSLLEDFDQEEYQTMQKSLKTWYIILNRLEVWERNLFVYYFFDDSNTQEKLQVLNLAATSYYTYMYNIKKKIREYYDN